MKRTWIWSGVVLLLLVLFSPSCVDISCATWEPGGPTSQPPATAKPATTQPSGDTSTTSATPATFATTTTQRTPTTFVTTTSQVTPTTRATTTTTAYTTTTLGPVDAYRAEMRAWKNTYAADMAGHYETVKGMKNPLRPSQTEVQAAKDLDALLDRMVGDLERIKPPARYSNPHANYLASLDELSSKVHDLAVSLDDGKSVQIVKAIAEIAVTWERGEPARVAMERTLGFSLSSQD